MRDKKRKKDERTVGAVIKAVLIIFLVGNLVFTGISIFMGETEYIGEVLLHTGITVALNLFLLLGTELCGVIGNKRWKEKNQTEFYIDDSYQTLKCSNGYYFLYLTMIVVDAITIFMYCNWYEGELVDFFRIYPAVLWVVAMNLMSVVAFLYYNGTKVFYTKHFFCVIHHLHRDTVSWSSLQRIEYHCYKNPKLVFVTREKRIMLKEKVLTEGWSDFMTQVKNTSEVYNIDFVTKIRKDTRS